MADANSKFCIIVGAGMSGLAQAAQILKQKALSKNDFLIFDGNDDFGGVWQANQYPGAACDVPSHAYVLRFHLKADWNREYAEQPEIQRYYADLAAKYGLHGVTKFNTHVISATWDEKTLKYTVLVRDKKTGKESQWITNIIINAGGQFSRPKYANIPGKENFKGEQFHTSEWTKSIDLRGKRVAMIGTGPSTAQVAPEIQPIVKELILYQRSATYCVPRNDSLHPSWRKTLFMLFPPALWLYHVWWYLTIEGRKQMWLSGTKENKEARDWALGHLESTVKDPETRKKLMPHHEFGCKRLLVLDKWYPIFNQPNVRLITDKPTKITETGIISTPPEGVPVREMAEQPVDAYIPENIAEKPQELATEIDTLIWGTGFDMTHQGSHFKVYGVDGVCLDELWGDTPKAYYSVAVHKFPNFMMLLGPNSANFWSNLTTLVEIQSKYNVKLIKQIKAGCRTAPYAVNVTEEAQTDYNKFISSNMGNIAILSPGCNNYYTNSKGEATYWGPLRGWAYAWRLMWPKREHFNVFNKIRSTASTLADAKQPLLTVQES